MQHDEEEEHLLIENRVEQYPPWDSRCEWYTLRQLCTNFKASLPRQHVLTTRNTQAHIDQKTSTPYTLVHTLLSLCLIMLHREYVPFIPIRCPKPQGPLDPPMFPRDRYDVPPGFWDESARECFKAAREIMDLVQTCQQWNALVETPIVGFAIYTVAFTGVYCKHFPDMDPDGYMCAPRSSMSPDALVEETGGTKAAEKALETVGQMRPRLHMAHGWFKTIVCMHKYFKRMKSDFKKNVNSNTNMSGSEDSPASGRHLSVREGGVGGGLDEFTRLERILKEFGNLEDQDQDVEMKEISQRPGSGRDDAVFDDSPDNTTVKSEEAENNRSGPPEASRQQEGMWKAINAMPGATASRHPSVSGPSNGQFRSYESYPQQAPQQAPQAAQPTYNQHLSNFRPAYASETPVPPGGAPPSLTSPASHSASTASQPSPPFDRGNPMYAGWTPHNAAYTPQHPQAQAYSNAPTPQHHHQQPPPPPQQLHQQQPYQAYNTYSTSTTPQHPIQQQPPSMQQHLPPQQQRLSDQQQPVPPPPLPQQTQIVTWTPVDEEAFLRNIDTRLGGDDVACFVDGSEVSEWASKSLYRGGYGGEWLGNIWEGAGGGGMQ